MDNQVTDGFCLTISIPMLSPPKQTRLPPEPEMGQEVKKLTWNPESPLAALEKSSMPNQCKKQSKIMSLLFFVMVKIKTVTENWVIEAPSVGTILAYLETRNKTFFVFRDRKLKIFSICLKKISAHSDNFYFHFFYHLSD